MITITFPDGSTKRFPKGSTPRTIAESISSGLAQAVIAAKADDKLIDLTTPLEHDTKLTLLKPTDKEGLEVLRHSCAHLLAHAVKRLYPGALPTIGPPIENGFYYDFANLPIKEGDLEKLEQEMRRIAKEGIPAERIEHHDKAEALAAYKDNPYKVEMIQELGEGASSYRHGDFQDLCRGPHVPNSKFFTKAGFKLDKLAGAYWRGKSENAMLTRIYGLCFATKKELDAFLKLREEAEKRDHRKLGQQLKLFSMHEEAPGMPFFHDNGYYLFRKLTEFMVEEMERLDYKFLRTPLILDKQLWLQSGHWAHYKENMYFSKIDEHDVAVKPMNCPGHILVYKNEHHSYRELPIKAGEFGIVHRHELSGVLSGLFRVRCFTQDDAHIFCTKEQIGEQIEELIDLVHRVYSAFGFSYAVELSTKPEKAMGDERLWELAEKSLAEALKKKKLAFQINEGDGAFYGPKIDFHVRDALGRSWQCGTIQLDFSMPEKFDLSYEGSDGQKHRPVMIHRAIYGSLERFIGILIEHYAGKFPLWLSPEPVRVLPIADRHVAYAEEVVQEFRSQGIRARLDKRPETTSKKVREAQLAQVNYILVVGDQELAAGTVSVRTRDGKVQGAKKLSLFVEEVKKAVIERH
ncbi:threonine--tRNA ligase [Candidatus Woesearchaeota archaeon]|nr:MAG: threonine--tRNA ligase [Candidatus Woesearchaeota archaeon]